MIALEKVPIRYLGDTLKGEVFLKVLLNYLKVLIAEKLSMCFWNHCRV